MTSIGDKIIELRKKYNFTQEKLAEKLDVSRQTVSSWESDITSPSLAQASILAKTLKVSLDELTDNNIEIECKNNLKNQIFNNIIDEKCYLTLSDDYFDIDVNETIPVKVLSVNEDFIKVEYNKNKKPTIKLIDIDLVVAIKVIKGDDE